MLAPNGFRVVAPDLPGRGRSAFLRDPARYDVRTFIRSIAALETYRGKRNFIIGTSWGGMMALAYLAATRNTADRLILNDIVVRSNPDLKRMHAAIREDSHRVFATREEAADYVRKSRDFLGAIPAALWSEYLAHKIISVEGGFRLSYDPATTDYFDRETDFDFTDLLMALRVPTLMIYGRGSPFADRDLLARLERERANITVLRDFDAGHPPSLMTKEQGMMILGFLLSSS